MSAIARAALAALLFGAAAPASKLLLGRLEPFLLAGLLYLGAACAMAPFFLRERLRYGSRKLDSISLWRLTAAIVAGGIVGPVLLLFGLRLSSSGTVSLLLNTELAATAMLGVWLFGDQLTRRGWLGVGGVMLAGGLVSSASGWPGLASSLLVFAACACWGLDNHWTAAIDGITPQSSTFWKGLIAGAINLTVAFWTGSIEEASPQVIGMALGVGGLSYGASIALYIGAAQQLGATRAQAVFASAPFLGAAIGFGLLGEPIAALHILGAALLALSLVLLLSSAHEHEHEHSPTEHIHAHRHDDGHHLHAHAGLAGARHTHLHRHDALRHTHPHWPDVHHRHAHRRDSKTP